MKQKYLIMIFMVLLISSCNLVPKKDITTVSTLYKGTDGLKISFVKNAPPSRVFENTQFQAIVKIENKGTYNVGFDDEGKETEKKGIFVITPETGYVDFQKIEVENEEKNKKKVSFKIRGRSLSNPIGDDAIIYSTLKARKLASLSSIHSSSVFATICYPYQTKLSTSVCIDPDVYDLKPGEKACKVGDLGFTSQGAPVAITKVEVDMIQEGDKIKPKFLLHIENKGEGEVVKKENYGDACKEKIEKSQATDQLYKYFNVITIKQEDTKLSDLKLECKQGENKEMVLSGKKGIITCELKENLIDANVDAYVAPLTIVLDYGYTSTISKGFNIEK